MQVTQRLGSIASGEHIRQGMNVQFQVLGSLYFVMKADDEKIVLFGQNEIITHKRREGIYYTIFSGQTQPEIMTNGNSGVAHLMVNGKSFCGTVGDVTQEMVSGDKVTCRHCLGNL